MYFDMVFIPLIYEKKTRKHFANTELIGNNPDSRIMYEISILILTNATNLNGF